MRRILACAIAILLFVPGLGGQDHALRIAKTIEIVEVKADTPDAAPSMFAAFAPMIKAMILPDGPVEQVMYIRGGAMRSELGGTLAIFPKGSVLLKPANRMAMVVINPAQRTFSKLPSVEGAGMPGLPPGMTPQTTVTETGETATIAGAKTEKLTFVIKFAMPSGGRELPTGFPTDLVVEGETWVAEGVFTFDEVALFEKMQKAMPMMGALGLDKLKQARPL